MRDLVERLRLSVTKGHEPTDQDAIDAANEIERLRAFWSGYESEMLLAMKADNEQLRAVLKNALTTIEERWGEVGSPLHLLGQIREVLGY